MPASLIEEALAYSFFVLLFSNTRLCAYKFFCLAILQEVAVGVVALTNTPNNLQSCSTPLQRV
jgi:hypothetical protein